MPRSLTTLLFFFFNDTATTEIYTLSLHDALPISPLPQAGLGRYQVGRPARGARESGRHVLPGRQGARRPRARPPHALRSEEHTSELQSPCNLVCRLLLEKKKKKR